VVSDGARAGEQPVRRTDVEPAGGAPPSQVELDAKRRPPFISDDDDENDSLVEDDGSGMAGGASGSSGGGSGMAGHPDAQR
jgi:hypothetical protein